MIRSAIASTGKRFRTRHISRRAQQIVISPIKEMSILADDFQDVISFGQGIPYFDTPAYIKDGIRLALTDPETAKYTLEPGMTELRQALRRHLEQNKGIQKIKAKQEIMISTGCQEAVACAIASILDQGDEVLLPSPCFASHTEQVLQFGGIPKMVAGIEKEGWRLDIEALEKAVTPNTKAILFSNPCNPTGAVLNEEEIRAIADLAIRHDIIIITDETYDFLTYDGVEHFSPASLPELRDRVILCGSFSKKYAMTGYRVGYAFADEGILDHMLKVHDALTICSPAISQKAALTAITGSQDSVKDHIEKFSHNRDAMMRELDQLSDFFSYQKPKGAYYIFAKVLAGPNVQSFQLALRLLQEAKVITIPGAAFGEGGEGHLRFSFAGEPAKIKEGFARIGRWFKTHSHEL